MTRLRTICTILTITALLACVDAKSQTTITSTTGGGTVTTNPANPATGVSVTAVSANPDITVITGSSTTSAFHIFNSTFNPSNANNTDLFRVQSDGNVGIGTSGSLLGSHPEGPGSKLSIAVGNVDGITVTSSNSGFLELGKSSATRWRWANDYHAANLLELLMGASGATPNTPIISITNGGNVGIGTTTAGVSVPVPLPKLFVGAGNVDGITVTSSNSGFLEVGKSGATRWRWANDYNFANHLELLVGTSGADPGTRIIDVTSSGNVGIDASPTSKFEIGTYLGPVQFKETSTLGVPHGILLNMTGTGEIDVAGITLGGAALPEIQSNGTLYLNRTSAGDVWVGNGTAANSLQVMGTGTSNFAGNVAVTHTLTAGSFSATYQDVAEWVPAAESMAAGTVVVISDDTNNTVTASTRAYDTGVAGVVSPSPGLLLGVEGSSKAKIATTGRVKVRVDASTHPIRIGDLLVTSERAGMAMKSEPLDVAGTKIHRPGTLIGKALEPLANGEGEILVLLSLQ